ncbi:MAG: sugar transferase [Rickettsiales bacterium]|jgi:lipopolysaccharide/colanic/teichoic acid biosynthesis glycosyltransferase|nr:sugar transferase [Rickettsiales bacterium]
MTDNNLTHNKFGLMLKRIMDVIGSIIALILFAPLMLIIILFIWKSKNSAFFVQTRMGKDGREFKCLKFQTMIPNALESLAEILERDPKLRAEWEENFKLKNDPRVTKLGKFLRKTSLDELPQFWNIIKGEMSLVGPRPVTRSEIDNYYKADSKYYYSLAPGLTGLWQISGRSDIDYKERIDLDKKYVQTRSFGQDIVILFKTVFVVVRPNGAY